MNRIVTIILTILLCWQVSAQEFTILRTKQGFIKYSDAEGNWLTELQWTEKYGRKAFRKAFPKPYRANHVEEENYTRWEIEKAFTIDYDVSWSRVFTSEANVEELIYMAALVLENPNIDGNKVSGELTDQMFVDAYTTTWSPRKYMWSANIVYEFREGRYKVSISKIKVRCSVSIDVLIGGIAVKDENPAQPLRHLLYEGDVKRHAYEDFLNHIDHTFCLVTFITPRHENDEW